MDNHPIPQDITGFQFKLIGNLTIRQFVYLAIGAILAWIFFFVLPLPALIKWPVSIISFAAGAIFAFVPIDGRPMDTMVKNFIRALSSPTQFLYKKTGGQLTPAASNMSDQATNSQIPTVIPNPSPTPILTTTPIPAAQPVIFQEPVSAPPIQAATPTPIPTPQPQPEIVPIPQNPAETGATDSVIHLSTPVSAPAATAFTDPTQIPVSVIEELSTPTSKKEEPNIDWKTEDENKKLQEEVLALKKQLEEKEKIVEAEPSPTPIQAPDQIALEKQLTESMRQKEELEKQLLEMQSKMSGPAQTFTPSTVAPLQQTQRVRHVPPGMERSVGLPSAPEAPNLITGIIKDSRGNPIPNILVEVKDADSNPVRAFKTNGLGKFASATSLSNGKYILTFEDSAEKHKFDAVEIELQGAPVMPLEIISVDPREELRRQLFN